MSIFKKKKLKEIEEKITELKFDKEKLKKNIIFMIRVYRNSNIKPPETKYSKLLLDQCDKIDPEHKLAERDLVDKLIDSEDVGKVFHEAALEGDTLVPDEVMKEYIDKYYEVLRGVMVSPDPGSWDQYEYQSQQMISLLSATKIELFKKYLQEKMDSDASCPYFLKKMFILIIGPQGAPTEKDEETAEEIMGMVCPGLQKERPEVFRALVDSLKWRGSEDLQRTLTSVKKTAPEKRHIRGRESCIFIETDEHVHYVG